MTDLEKEKKIDQLATWYGWLPRMAQLAVDKKCPDVEEKDEEWLRRRESAIDSAYLGAGGALFIVGAMMVGLAVEAVRVLM